MNNTEAYLSSSNGYTIFKYDEYVIRFIAPYSLERYVEIKEWDNGYIVVMTKYEHNPYEEKEYIDLVPILEHLYIDVEDFLKNIEKVSVLYD